jgi:hypothetical protein
VSSKRPNQALKLTWLSVCQFGGRAFARSGAMRRLCTSPAVQLNAGVGCRERSTLQLGRA